MVSRRITAALGPGVLLAQGWPANLGQGGTPRPGIEELRPPGKARGGVHLRPCPTPRLRRRLDSARLRGCLVLPLEGTPAADQRGPVQLAPAGCRRARPTGASF